MYYYNKDYSSAFSRLDFAKFINISHTKLSSVDSHFINKLKSLKSIGSYRVMFDAGRPDVISHKLYNNFMYWWILLLYNNKLSYRSIKKGDVLNFPSVDSIEALFFSIIRGQQ